MVIYWTFKTVDFFFFLVWLIRKIYNVVTKESSLSALSISEQLLKTMCFLNSKYIFEGFSLRHGQRTTQAIEAVSPKQ